MRSWRLRRRRSAAASSGEENEMRRRETEEGWRRRGLERALRCVKKVALERAMMGMNLRERDRVWIGFSVLIPLLKVEES